MKKTYHYTSIERWALIEADGQINTTESNLSKRTVESDRVVGRRS